MQAPCAGGSQEIPASDNEEQRLLPAQPVLSQGAGLRDLLRMKKEVGG